MNTLFAAVANTVRPLLGLRKLNRAVRTYYLTREGRVTQRKPKAFVSTVRAASLAEAQALVVGA